MSKGSGGWGGEGSTSSVHTTEGFCISEGTLAHNNNRADPRGGKGVWPAVLAGGKSNALRLDSQKKGG